MSPEYVRPYVKAQKNDDRDTEGIAEAASRPTMQFVDLKSEEQLDIQSLHRVRSRLVAERTTLINQMRAILLERGLIFAAGRCKFESAVEPLHADLAKEAHLRQVGQPIGVVRVRFVRCHVERRFGVSRINAYDWKPLGSKRMIEPH